MGGMKKSLKDSIGDVEILSHPEQWLVKIEYKKADGTWTTYANQLRKDTFESASDMLAYCVEQIGRKSGEYAAHP